MLKKTPLHDKHLAAQGNMVPFAGWEMPLHYGSQLEEHHAVRKHAGVFDVSHMTITDCEGERAEEYLSCLLANDIRRLKDGKALYTAMLNEQAGIIDDLICYRRGKDSYRLVTNAARFEVDLPWMQKHANDFSVGLHCHAYSALLAVHGPKAIELALTVLPAEIQPSVQALKLFSFTEGKGFFVARTGYTGEDGLEIAVAGDKAAELWDKLMAVGVKPIGLGARDTLRLEAGLNLYGSDMDESIMPYAANMTWTLRLKDDRNFIGKTALLAADVAQSEQLVGFVMPEGRAILRSGMSIETSTGSGVITSGAFSPTLGLPIAIARVPAACSEEASVSIRGKTHTLQLVSLPFIKAGQPTFTAKKKETCYDN